MTDWKTDKQGHLLVSALAGYTIAAANDEFVLLQLRLASQPGGEMEAVQVVMSPQEARDFSQGVVKMADELDRKPDSGSPAGGMRH